MQRIRAIARIFGAFSIVAGVLAFIPSLLLLNQHVRLVHTTWGISDVQIGDFLLSDPEAATLFGSVGLVLLLMGVSLTRRPRDNGG